MSGLNWESEGDRCQEMAVVSREAERMSLSVGDTRARTCEDVISDFLLTRTYERQMYGL